MGSANCGQTTTASEVVNMPPLKSAFRTNYGPDRKEPYFYLALLIYLFLLRRLPTRRQPNISHSLPFHPPKTLPSMADHKAWLVPYFSDLSAPRETPPDPCQSESQPTYVSDADEARERGDLELRAVPKEEIQTTVKCGCSQTLATGYLKRTCPQASSLARRQSNRSALTAKFIFRLS